MATDSKLFAPDTADDIRLQLGTTAAPENLTGATTVIRTKNRGGGAAVEAAGAFVGAASLGVVRRDWQSGEKPAAGGQLVVECIVTFADSTVRTYPGLDQPELVAEIQPRRTA